MPKAEKFVRALPAIAENQAWPTAKDIACAQRISKKETSARAAEEYGDGFWRTGKRQAYSA
jgi:hypothetical protein